MSFNQQESIALQVYAIRKVVDIEEKVVNIEEKVMNIAENLKAAQLNLATLTRIQENQTRIKSLLSVQVDQQKHLLDQQVRIIDQQATMIDSLSLSYGHRYLTTAVIWVAHAYTFYRVILPIIVMFIHNQDVQLPEPMISFLHDLGEFLYSLFVILFSK